MQCKYLQDGLERAHVVADWKKPTALSGYKTMALLSDGSRSLKNQSVLRNIPTNIPVYGVDSSESASSDGFHVVKLAENWEDFLDGTIQVNIAESMGVLSKFQYFWTGTTNTGLSAANHCNNWSVRDSNTVSSTISNRSGETSNWLDEGSPAECVGTYMLLGVAYPVVP